MAPLGETDESGGFVVAVDHLLRKELAGDAERVCIGHVCSLHEADPIVYMV